MLRRLPSLNPGVGVASFSASDPAKRAYSAPNFLANPATFSATMPCSTGHQFE